MISNDKVFSVEAKRGYVYLFHDDNAQWVDKYVLVVSNDSRATDKMVSILVLGDSSAGSDVVPINIPNKNTMYVHTGMVTYIGRHLLGDKVCELSKKTMNKINYNMLIQYGLIDTQKVVEFNFYKEMYEELLDKTTIR